MAMNGATRARTTEAPPLDMAEAVPGLGAYARTVVRLHPRPGTPDISSSHIGGPVLWPADEPWPHCSDPKYSEQNRHKTPDRPVAMVPVAQLAAADFPEIAFPAGTDLAQILWCPSHHPTWGYAPAFRLIWRDSSTVTAPLAAPPTPHLIGDADYVPRPCVLHPERVIEYPWHEELPKDLRDKLEEWEAGESLYQYMLSIVPGCKVGGGMSWEVTDMGELPPCDACGAPLKLLLQLDSCEWSTDAQGLRWAPMEDRHLEFATPEHNRAHEPTGLQISRYSHGGFFVCSTAPEHPAIFFTQ
ncbi:hypothetical protein Airi01_028780 [Actinoallomurus iriomotensis]|uniref:DUF1963 domain-containing protein n=1 Tax=Actinoallomurus iriomotensis TaxID=478107 RepID=A0A9W6REJ1_9ACTN|nr:hypothetical protein Airi01_028780 [Actinoallomurus iriomotensis]